MERFEKLPLSEVQRITFGIATVWPQRLGRTILRKYRLESVPGSYSGLYLVCLMYVGFRMFAPEQDIGFDLPKEHAAAKALHGQKRAE